VIECSRLGRLENQRSWSGLLGLSTQTDALLFPGLEAVELLSVSSTISSFYC
jgi:hypothetical protein